MFSSSLSFSRSGFFADRKASSDARERQGRGNPLRGLGGPALATGRGIPMRRRTHNCLALVILRTPDGCAYLGWVTPSLSSQQNWRSPCRSGLEVGPANWFASSSSPWLVGGLMALPNAARAEEAIIRHAGDHPTYSVELEPHASRSPSSARPQVRTGSD